MKYLLVTILISWSTLVGVYFKGRNDNNDGDMYLLPLVIFLVLTSVILTVIYFGIGFWTHSFV